MRSFSLASLLLFAALAAGSATLRAADSPAKVEKPVKADVQSSIDQFNAKREALIAAHQALIDRLKGATAEQKKAIIDQMQAQQKDLLETQRELGRQIRDELRKLRQG